MLWETVKFAQREQIIVMKTDDKKERSVTTRLKIFLKVEKT